MAVKRGPSLFAFVVLLLAIFCFAASTMTINAQPTSYDLENFSVGVGAGAAAAVTLSGLKVGSSNPTLGSTGSLIFEFTTGAELSTTFSILALLPAGYQCTPRVLARITTIVGGQVDRQGAWIGSETLLGAKVDSTFQPTSARLFIPITFKIAKQTTLRIEINNVQAPLTFGAMTAACRSQIAQLPVTSLLLPSEECCAGFQAFLVAGVGAGFGLPNLGLALGAGFAVYGRVSAEICPNFGLDDDDFQPQECATTLPSLWSSKTQRVCCQYEAHKWQPYCDTTICVQDEARGVWNATRCCDVLGVKKLHAECPLCSPGHFPTNICCDGFQNATRQAWRENDDRCLDIVCWCEEWESPKCCYQHLGSPYYDPIACPDCDVSWNTTRCCEYPEYANDKRCLCEDNNDYLADWCCQFNATRIEARCPTQPCETEPCECEEEELSCPCALLGGPCAGGNSTGGNSYVKYDNHELTAQNITSGHNTVLINHLHIDVDGADNSTDLQTLIQLSLQSGGEGGLLEQIRDKIKSDVETIVGDVKDKLDEITEPIKNVLDATVGKPVRQILRVLRNNPLNALELTTLRIIYNTQLMLQAHSNAYSVKFVNQYKVGASANIKDHAGIAAAAAADGKGGHVLTADVSEPDTSQEKLLQVTNAAANNVAANAAKAFGATMTVDSTLAVSASNECPINTCSPSCQCELFYACAGDDHCLSGKCDSKKKVCVDPSVGTSASFKTFSAMALALLVIIASLILTVRQYD